MQLTAGGMKGQFVGALRGVPGPIEAALQPSVAIRNDRGARPGCGSRHLPFYDEGGNIPDTENGIFNRFDLTASRQRRPALLPYNRD
jgi:hypothetical protein